MIRFIYTLILTLASPILLYGLYKKKEGKPPFGKRWKEHWGATPELNSTTQPIWLHAVSVGESIAATPIIKALKVKYPDTPILVTTTTSTGAEQVQKLDALVEHRYMPLDFPFAIKRFLKTVNPKAMLIMETELWPNTIHYVAKRDIPIALLNARLSDTSAQGYMKVKSLFNTIVPNLSLVLCQNKRDKENFCKLGIPKERCKITSNIKYDININPEVQTSSKELKELLGVSRPVWIAASTHPGEDEQIIQAHKQILTKAPNTLLILVPRHPERFSQVAALCSEMGMSTVKRSEKSPVTHSHQIYLGDTMGEMLTMIGASDICFMAGSLIGKKVGGHNMLEPAALGIPVLTGPSYFNFREVVEDMCDHNLITIINTPTELAEQVVSYLNSGKVEKAVLSSSLQRYMRHKTGAVSKSINYIAKII